MTVAEKSLMMTLSPKLLQARVSSAINFPLSAPDATSMRTLPSASRWAARLARNFSSRTIRL